MVDGLPPARGQARRSFLFALARALPLSPFSPVRPVSGLLCTPPHARHRRPWTRTPSVRRLHTIPRAHIVRVVRVVRVARVARRIHNIRCTISSSQCPASTHAVYIIHAAVPHPSSLGCVSPLPPTGGAHWPLLALLSTSTASLAASRVTPFYLPAPAPFEAVLGRNGHGPAGNTPSQHRSSINRAQARVPARPPPSPPCHARAARCLFRCSGLRCTLLRFTKIY